MPQYFRLPQNGIDDYYETPSGRVLVKASPEELVQREIDAYRRELAGVQYRIDNLEIEMTPHEVAQGKAYADKKRQGWQDLAQTIRDTLKALGADVPAEPTKRAAKK